MRRSTVTRRIGFALAFLVLLPVVASAQSTIAGVVSRVAPFCPGSRWRPEQRLIEKPLAVTDAQGAYKIVDSSGRTR
jgi:hypothetical protein